MELTYSSKQVKRYNYETMSHQFNVASNTRYLVIFLVCSSIIRNDIFRRINSYLPPRDSYLYIENISFFINIMENSLRSFSYPPTRLFKRKNVIYLQLSLNLFLQCKYVSKSNKSSECGFSLHCLL